VGGEWQGTKNEKTIPDPLNGEPFISYPDIQADETQPFIESLRAVPKTGLHNPLKNPERYLMYGSVSARMAEEMRKPEVTPHKWHLQALNLYVWHCFGVSTLRHVGAMPVLMAPLDAYHVQTYRNTPAVMTASVISNKTIS
jgi:hypothetical protein